MKEIAVFNDTRLLESLDYIDRDLIAEVIDDLKVPDADEIPGKSNFGCEDGSINLAKILEYTFNHGRDRLHGDVQMCLDLGGLTDFDTFDKLWDAYTREVEYLTRIHLDLCNYGVDIRSANVAKLVKSCMTEACIERGLNLDDGGAIYNYGCIETAGHGTVGDSLYAIKKLVYDEKKISLETLDAALKANFEGYDEVLLFNFSSFNFLFFR